MADLAGMDSSEISFLKELCFCNAEKDVSFLREYMGGVLNTKTSVKSLTSSSPTQEELGESDVNLICSTP